MKILLTSIVLLMGCLPSFSQNNYIVDTSFVGIWAQNGQDSFLTRTEKQPKFGTSFQLSQDGALRFNADGNLSLGTWWCLNPGFFSIQIRDSVEKTVFERDGDLFYTPKDTLCEIDLASAKFWDDFPDGEAKKLQLKKLGETYYLNVLEKNVGDGGKDYWFVVKFDFQQSELSITNTSINDSTFAKRLDYYNKIARIEKLGSSQYLCNADDEAFFRLFEEEGLFERVVWESVAPEQKLGLFNVVGLVVLGLVVLGVVIFGVRFFFSKKRANPS